MAGEGGEGGEIGEGGSTGEGGSSGAGGEDGGPTCPQHWQYDICSLSAGASAGIDVKSGAMVLTETASEFMCGGAMWPPYTLKVFQSGLAGDFTVSFDYEGFTSGGYGVGVHAFVVELNNDQETAAASIVDSGAGTNVKAAVEHEGQKQEEVKGTSSTSGKLTIQRLGGFLTVTAAAGGDSKSVTSQFTKNNLVVGIALQGPYEPGDPPVASSVSIPAFNVTGGGGKVVADSFDCNSVK